VSLPPNARKLLEEIRDAGYGLVMTEDRILFDGMNIRDSHELQRGEKDDGTFDEMRALVADVFQQKRRGSA
jgi:hypothetical protein